MSGSFCLICLSLIVSTVVPEIRCQTHDSDVEDSQERPVVPQEHGVHRIKSDDPRARLKGLCRDGWSPGTMKVFSGKEIPICLKINPEAQTWSEAQASCRNDYGFLLKLDSKATVNEMDIFSSVIANEITQFWTGMHTENSHLIWDDLIPNQVRPHNRLNDTTVPERPWTWENNLSHSRQQYCGQMNVDTDDDGDDDDDDRRRRRKRSADDDSSDNAFPGFDRSNFQDTMLNNGFARRRNNIFPPTSAFQTMLSRTQMSDQLAELPGTLGIQSEHQIPGSGLSDANIQNGGLATDTPNFEQQETEQVSPFGNTDTSQIDNMNTDSNENPTSNSEDLLMSVREAAANIGSDSGELTHPTPTEAVETLRNLMQQNTDSFNTDSTYDSTNSNSNDIPDPFWSGTTTETHNPINTDSFNGPATMNPLNSFTPDVDRADSTKNVIDTALTDGTDSMDEININEIDPLIPDDDIPANTNVDSNTKPFTDEVVNVAPTDAPLSFHDDLGKASREHVEHIAAGVLNTNADDMDFNTDSDDSTSEGVLGFGHVTDILADAAINEDMTIKNLNGNTDDSETVSDRSDVTDHTVIPTTPGDVKITVSNELIEKGSIPPISDTSLIDDIDNSFEDVVETSSEIQSDPVNAIESDSLTGIIGDTVNIFKNIDDNGSTDNSEDNSDDLLPDIKSHDGVSDHSVKDVIETVIDTADDSLGVDINDDGLFPDTNDVVEHLNKISQEQLENASEIIDHINDANSEHLDIDVSALSGESDGDVKDKFDDLLSPTTEAIEQLAETIVDNVSEDPDTNDDVMDLENDSNNSPELEAGGESVMGVDSLNDDSIIDDEISDTHDDIAESPEIITPEMELESTTADIYEAVSDSLGLSGDEHENEDKESTTKDQDPNEYTEQFDSIPNVLDSLSNKDNNRELSDILETDDDNSQTINNIDDVKLGDIENGDDSQTKRDSDWSEFDWNDDNQGIIRENVDSENDELELGDAAEHVDEGISAEEIASDTISDLHEHLENENGDDQTIYHDDKDVSDTFDDLHDNVEDTFELSTESENEIDSPTSLFEDNEENEENEENAHFDEIPDLAEDIVELESKTAIAPVITRKEMQLSSCEVRLPSVCFGYEVEVMDKASTCENGWYGHVLLDTCYKILDNKMGYLNAVSECKTHHARLVMSGSEFERKFVLIAIQKEARLFRGAKFWMESSSDKSTCKYFNERGVNDTPSCADALHVVCVKDAKSLSVYTMNNSPLYGGDTASFYDDAREEIYFSSQLNNNNLPCGLTSAAVEFPVLWFKDGLLVETKDVYISSDLSLYLNPDLVSAVSKVADRAMATPALQGQYWCEVWNRQTLTRKRSRPYNVRFSDVISFHGSMEIPAFSNKNEVLFNMMNRKFPELSSVEADIQKVFYDAMPMIQAHQPDVTNVFTFVDGIRSSPNVIEYHTYFTLNRDYTTHDENAVYNRLKAVLRSKLGNRNYMADLPGQTSLAAFRTMSLQSTVSCPAASLQTTRDLYGHTLPVKVFSFPKALLGEFTNSIDNCSVTNSLPAGTARCLGDFYTGAYWGEIAANDCIEEAVIDQFNNEIWGASPYTDKLTEIAQVTVDERNVGQIVSEVAHIVQVARTFTPTDINKIADVLEHTTQVHNLPRKVGQNVVNTVNRLMTNSEHEVHVANVETKAANRIIKSLERCAENADLGTSDQMRFVSDNVVVEIWNIKPSTRPVIGLAAESQDSGIGKSFKTQSIATVYNKSQLYEANVDAAIELPSEIFSMNDKGTMDNNRLTMMVFRKCQLFQAAITDGGNRMSPMENQLSNLNSYVISASIAGRKLEDLNEKVKTIYKPIKDSVSGRSCVWWDFDMNNFKGGWSNKGCVFDGRVNGRDVCLCDHLTNFAVLIDFYGQGKPIPDHHELSLSIITLVGLSCSILGLSLTIISYLFFRKLRQGRAQQTLFNLSLALVLAMLVFLVGIKQTHSYHGCVVVAILLHYLILVSFMWMLMEAVLQYLTFVKILGTYITRFTLKTVLPAWGLPLIPVTSVLCIDYTLYKGGPKYCWMDLPAFYYAFVVPITCIIIINIIIFVVTIVSIFRRGKGLRSNQKKHKMAITNLQAAITSFILLGLTWVFGYLAISDARVPFQYVFTILNSLQGFFIFILFVVRKKKVREQWYFICCNGMEKDRVSRSLSASNSLPSTYSNGSNRNSRKTGRERDRSDSTKTVQSTYSITSNGYTNYGYDHGYDFPFKRYDRRAFRKF